MRILDSVVGIRCLSESNSNVEPETLNIGYGVLDVRLRLRVEIVATM